MSAYRPRKMVRLEVEEITAAELIDNSRKIQAHVPTQLGSEGAQGAQCISGFV